ncbi:MAG: TIR domain-containing protein [Anaerolineae bacterium]|nr:TIR domain-containing protein [Anaerolineae bacterium]
MAKVFVSYSRKDIEFAKRLTGELQKSDLDFWIDWEGIPPTVDWWREIEKGIEEADVFIFLISPDSAKSKVCAREIDSAVKNGKRLIPLVVRDIKEDETPSQLSHLNWIFFRENDDFDAALQKLLTGIHTDYEWVHEHTRLLGRAREWDASGRNPNLLLRGPHLDNAQAWIAKAGAIREPKPLPLHGEYIQASQRDAVRRMRITQGVGLAFIVIMVIATVVSFIGFRNASDERDKAQVAEGKAIDSANAAATAQANAEANLAQSERLRLALEAKEIMDDPLGNAETAALLSLQALKSRYVPQADVVLGLALSRMYTLQAYRGHSDSVESVALSPDGKFVLTGSDDGTASLWDVATGKELIQFVGHTNQVKSVAFSSDGKYVLTAGDDETARIWDTATGKEVLQFVHTDNVKGAVFSPDGKYVLTGSSDSITRLWDAATGQEVRQFVGHEDNVNSVAFSSDGKYALTGSDDQTARLWDAETGQEVNQFIGHTREVLSMSFSPDGKFVLTGSDTIARMFDAVTGDEVLQFIGHADRVRAVAFSSDGKYVLTGSSDTTARLWDVATGQEVRKFTGHTDSIRSVAFSSDGRYVLTGGIDQTTRLWEASLNQGTRQFIGHASAIYSIVFSPDGKYLLTGSGDNSVRLWDVVTNQEILRFLGHTNWVSSVAFSPTDEVVLTGSKDRTARLWDTATGEEIRVFNGHTDEINSVAFSPDGQFVLTGSDDETARLWETGSGNEVREFSGHTKAVKSVAFSPDGRFILTGSDDQTARLWDAGTGEEIRQFSGHTDEIKSVAFSSDGKYVLTGGDDQTARLWDTATGEEIRQFTGHTNQVKSVAFSSDGKYVLTGSDDTTARLWDTATGQEVRSLIAHTAPVRSVAFSSDGKYVLTGSVDKTARLWDTDYQAMMQFACAHLVRNLTDEERSRYLVFDNTPTCDPGMAASIVVPISIAESPVEIPTAELQNFYTEEFDGNLDTWSSFMTSGIDRQVETAFENGSLKIQLSPFEDRIPRFYWVNHSFTYTNVRLEAVTTNNGNNANGVSMICHYNDYGWYEFTVSNAGLYTIYAFDTTLPSEQGYFALATGGSSAIKTGQATNNYTAVCKGNELSLYVNGILVKTLADNSFNFTEGNIGIGASSPQKLPVDIQFESVSVSNPE